MKQFILAFAATASAIKINSDPIEGTGGPLKKTDDGHLPYGDYFKANYHNFSGTDGFAPTYDRKMPEHFQDKHLDDMFMHSMINNYAKEGRNPDGTANGKFYLDRDAGYQASKEVVTTHLGLVGDELKNYLDHNFDEAWDYYDVNHENLIEADRMSTLFRYLCHDANLNIQ